MFTGLIESRGCVESARRHGAASHLTVAIPAHWGLVAGESVAVSGVCLTAVVVEPGRVGFDLADETLRVTTLGELAPGDAVNLERPLRLGARLGGHLVLGHVDGVGRVVRMEAEGAGRRLTIVVPAALRPLLIPKGSVAVDGVSLTVAGLEEAAFSVALVPHTMAVTTLGDRGAGARVNLEMDVLGKYVQALLTAGEPAREWLERQGLPAPHWGGLG